MAGSAAETGERAIQPRTMPRNSPSIKDISSSLNFTSLVPQRRILRPGEGDFNEFARGSPALAKYHLT